MKIELETQNVTTLFKDIDVSTVFIDNFDKMVMMKIKSLVESAGDNCIDLSTGNAYEFSNETGNLEVIGRLNIIN